MGNVNIRGNSELSSVSATSLSADQVSVAGSITGDDITLDDNVVVGDIRSPAGPINNIIVDKCKKM